ncbi:hypothetical protein EYZ11_002581 [Aspergillus tanneri]|uniref:Uncharacterized protein n=1 Tax=Aspergillus tanneri TaxID=1220188 RepID=A0A4V6RQX4_9EURO|nr:hypothetical protein EYZ11_002581 [Aspergillus tanneri]
MDAEDDREVKLQRASGDLMKEFSDKLPSLLWKTRTEQGGDTRVPRRWAHAAKTEKLVSLLEPFQEWPQLLDPYLQTLLPYLVDAFLAYLIKHRDQYALQPSSSQQTQELYPLPRAAYDIPVPYDNLNRLGSLPSGTSTFAKSLLSVSLNYVNVPGKEREAASALLARLVLRRDMQTIGLLTTLTEWAFSIVQPTDRSEPPSLYTCIGVLSFLARLGTSGQVEEFAPLIVPVFDQTLRVAQGTSEVSEVIKSSALARKIIIKIIRTVTVMALSLSERPGNPLSDDIYSSILEEAIDHFLVALADKDTPVRFAASKALSVITLKLDLDMAREVIEAVTGSLEENILYEKSDGTIVTPLDARVLGVHKLKRNLSAVDPQRWQGLILTLGHLLFRRAPPTRQLLEVIQPLVSGLDFEQRSSTGNSVGTGVRDASCFGIWAISRKYTTQELLELKPQAINTPTNQNETSVLQILAIELVCAACVDPSGNIRRGASAALQELVGRHPNTVAEGISLVQVVDYHAVSRRSRAINEVAKATVDLSPHYWSPLVESLMHWRGIGSPAAESRRQAAKAIGALSTQDSYKSMGLVLRRLVDKLNSLPQSNVETRHGCFLALSAIVEAFNDHRETFQDMKDSSEARDVVHQIGELWSIFNSAAGPTKKDLTLQISRPELTAEAASCLIFSLSRSVSHGTALKCPQPSTDLLDKALETLLLCVSRGEDISIETSSSSLSSLFPLLTLTKQHETIQDWLSHIHATWKLPTSRGQISVLGAVFKQLDPENSLRQSIVEELLRCADKEELIEKRVVAVKSLSAVLPHIDVTDTIADHITRLLNDYTTDRRGDIGSLIRLEAIQAAKIIFEKDSSPASFTPRIQTIVGCLCRLATEKLDKVRLQAWLCLQSFWETAKDFPPLQRRYEHFSHVSSTDYFLQILELDAIDWLRVPLLQGIATSAAAGTERLIRSTRSALVQRIKSREGVHQQAAVVSVIKDLLIILNDNLLVDRYTVPVMELLAFLVDGYISSIPEKSKPSFQKLFVLVQKAHFKSSNIARLEAAIGVYAPLSRLEPLRLDVLKKMTGMLLHPFPRVRNSIAEALFMETGLDVVKLEDWTRPPKELKGLVDDLLRGLCK